MWISSNFHFLQKDSCQLEMMEKFNCGSSQIVVLRRFRTLGHMMTGSETLLGATILDYNSTQLPHARKIKSLKFGGKRTTNKKMSGYWRRNIRWIPHCGKWVGVKWEVCWLCLAVITRFWSLKRIRTEIGTKFLRLMKKVF